MKTKGHKEIELPIDWDISKPNPSIFQIPDRSKKNLLIPHNVPNGEKGVQTAPMTSIGSQKKDHDSDDILSGSRQDRALFKDPMIDYQDSAGKRATKPQWQPDLYVHAFVPKSLTAINQSPAAVVYTPPIEGVDFGEYVSTFAGSQFLSAPAPLPFPKSGNWPLVDSLEYLKPQTYGQFFEENLALDIEARIPEIRSYDLFRTILEPRDLQQQLYTLTVPGIRENTPFVSFGDSIMLRQLILDPATKLPMGMDSWLAPGGGFERGEQAPGFTGYQLNAVIVGIDKSSELLFIRAHGIIWVEPVVCNVSFVVQARLIESLQRAAADIAKELEPKKSSGERTKIATRSTSRFDTNLTENRTIEDVQLGEPSESSWLRRILFPEEANGIQQTTLPSFIFSQSWFDEGLNYEQKKAVDAVQSGTYGNFCYLINGPPGTGKTRTLCEIVAQLGHDPDFSGSILVCAPSDPAADTLALRLRSYFDQKSLLRLNHFSRTFAEVPQELLLYCYVKDDLFGLPPMPELMAYKVVVTTCQTADVLVHARVTNRDLINLQSSLADAIHPDSSRSACTLHWTALLVDEAAQATEPETLIPLSVVSPPSTTLTQSPVFVMAGDQHQLNPWTYGRSITLHISLFERLSEMPVYASHPLARKNLHRIPSRLPMLRPAFVNLIRNYRSHPAILAVPSSLFYDNTLIPEASQTDSLSPWTGWQGRRWPVLFACSAGADECEDIRSVGGWYNLREAQKAISYALHLLGQGLMSDHSEICIMSPYQAQVNLLRKLARQAKLWGVDVGPMDAFQGLERRFVILCTTRARKRFLREDSIKGIGIVNEKKKFNVAITRAKEGLIVIGNPWILATDPHWLAFLEFCWRNSLWQCDNEPSAPAPDFEENEVNEWRPDHQSKKLSGLETALVYKERDKTAGSRAVNRFMAGNDTTEDALWRSGLAAQEALKTFSSVSGAETEAYPKSDRIQL